MPGSERYAEFMALHTREGGLVLPNAWDGLSALMLADAGFEAVATSSAALAATLGRPDGRHEVTRGEHLEHAGRLGRLTGLPVNGDFEDGWAAVAPTPVNVLVSPSDQVLTSPNCGRQASSASVRAGSAN